MSGPGDRRGGCSALSPEAVCNSILKTSVNSLRAEVSSLTLESRRLRDRLLRAKLKARRLRQALEAAQAAAAASCAAREELRLQARELCGRSSRLEEELRASQSSLQTAAETIGDLRRKLSASADSGQTEQLKTTYLKHALQRHKQEKEGLRAELLALKTVELKATPPQSQTTTAQKSVLRTQRFILPFNIVSQKSAEKTCAVLAPQEFRSPAEPVLTVEMREAAEQCVCRLEERVVLLRKLRTTSVELTGDELLSALGCVLRQTGL